MPMASTNEVDAKVSPRRETNAEKELEVVNDLGSRDVNEIPKPY